MEIEILPFTDQLGENACPIDSSVCFFIIPDDMPTPMLVP